MRRRLFASLLFVICASQPAIAQIRGYYRQPALHGNTLVFVSEGDLWKTTAAGGVAQRLTTNLAEETTPQISPDGNTIAFTGRFDNLADVYTIPVQGGVPRRHSWDGISQVVGWTNDGRIMYTTSRYTTLPGARLVLVDPKTNTREQVKLEQAWDGSFAGDVLFFTRLPPAAQSTRMYTGGTAQKIWKYEGTEAVCLTCDWKGTSRSAKVFNNRVFFLSDRGADKVMNIWSMDFGGKGLIQHTSHKDYEVRDYGIADGRLVYQQGADLWMLSPAQNATGQPVRLAITIASDLEQMRDRVVRKPMDFLTDFHIDHKGERISLIARGVAFIAPVGQGRFVQLPNNGGVRYRDMRFAPDGKTVYALNDRSGEVELWGQPADGTSNGSQLTHDADILRWDLEVSPDGRFIAHDDKNQKLYVYDAQSKAQRQIAFSKNGGFSYGWTADNKLLYIETAANTNGVIKLYDVVTAKTEQLTTDRFPSFSAVVTPDANWLYFLSNRTFNTSVGSPWGQLQPEPYFNNRTKIYAVRLSGRSRFAFAPRTEIADSVIEYAEGALHEVPVPAGNYSSLTTDGKRLYFVSRADVNSGRDAKLNSVEIKNDDVKVEVFADGVSQYELSGDTKKILFRKGDDFYVVNAGAKAPGDLSESKVDLSGWMLMLERKDELKNLFTDMWRLERDYFYDPGMHGLDWVATRKKYEPLAARVGDRSELNDVVSQMIAELSALHMNVRGGDIRGAQDTLVHGSLGAVLEGAEGGWKVAKVYRTDPDLPGDFGPLLKPGVNVSEGDVIRAINGVPLSQVRHPAELLVGKAGKQTLIELTNGRKAIVHPVSVQQEFGLRYADWEYSRKQMVDRLSNGKVGYVHLRAMGPNDINQFARDYYSQFMKDALIIDVRNNNGGNIDSWILAKLMREAWMYWSDRVGDASWNMQYAFRGPMATIVNELSASDGEIFPEGFRRLGLGKVFGTRTWGGEIWLTSSNVTADRGIATAAEFGVFADGKWIIEQHGVDPDVVVENYPAATFAGSDAQLEATVRHLLEEVAKNPKPLPTKPPYPKK